MKAFCEFCRFIKIKTNYIWAESVEKQIRYNHLSKQRLVTDFYFNYVNFHLKPFSRFWLADLFSKIFHYIPLWNVMY